MYRILWKCALPIIMAILSRCVLSIHLASDKSLNKQSRNDVQRISKCVGSYAAGLDKIHKNLGDAIRAHPLIANFTLQQNIIFGAGFGSTATRSLDTALALIGLQGDHYSDTMAPLRKVLALPSCGLKLDHLFRDKKTFTHLKEYILDTPMAELFLDFFLTFSEAKFILTTRPADMWTSARSKKISPDTYMPRERPCADHLKGKSFANISYMFSLHSELVRCVVPQDRLFEINVWNDPPDRMEHIMEKLATFTSKKLSRYPYTASFKIVSMSDTTRICPSKNIHDRLSSFRQKNPLQAQEETISVLHGDLKIKILPSEFGIVMQAAALEGCEIVLEKHH